MIMTIQLKSHLVFNYHESNVYYCVSTCLNLKIDKSKTVAAKLV